MEESFTEWIQGTFLPYLLMAVCIVVTILSVLLNTLLLVTIKQRNVHLCAFHRLLIQLAILDFLACLVLLIPVSVVVIMSSWQLTTYFCNVQAVAFTFVYLSNCTLVGLLCIERYAKASHESLHQKMFNKGWKIVLLSLLIWIINLGISVLPVFGWIEISYYSYHAACVPRFDKAIYYLVGVFFVGLCLTFVVGVFTLPCILRSMNRKTKEENTTTAQNSFRRQNRSVLDANKREKLTETETKIRNESQSNLPSASKNVAKLTEDRIRDNDLSVTMVIMWIILILCWLPYFIVVFYASFQPDVWNGLYTITLTIVVVYFFLKPLIYLAQNSHYDNKVESSLYKSTKKPNSNAWNSTSEKIDKPIHVSSRKNNKIHAQNNENLTDKENDKHSFEQELDNRHEGRNKSKSKSEFVATENVQQRTNKKQARLKKKQRKSFLISLCCVRSNQKPSSHRSRISHPHDTDNISVTSAEHLHGDPENKRNNQTNVSGEKVHHRNKRTNVRKTRKNNSRVVLCCFKTKQRRQDIHGTKNHSVNIDRHVTNSVTKTKHNDKHDRPYPADKTSRLKEGEHGNESLTLNQETVKHTYRKESLRGKSPTTKTKTKNITRQRNKKSRLRLFVCCYKEPKKSRRMVMAYNTSPKTHVHNDTKGGNVDKINKTKVLVVSKRHAYNKNSVNRVSKAEAEEKNTASSIDNTNRYRETAHGKQGQNSMETRSTKNRPEQNTTSVDSIEEVSRQSNGTNRHSIRDGKSEANNNSSTNSERSMQREQYVLESDHRKSDKKDKTQKHHGEGYVIAKTDSNVTNNRKRNVDKINDAESEHSIIRTEKVKQQEFQAYKSNTGNHIKTKTSLSDNKNMVTYPSEDYNNRKRYDGSQTDFQKANCNNETAELDHSRTVYKTRQKDTQMSNYNNGTPEHKLDHSSAVRKTTQKDIQMSNHSKGTVERELEHSSTVYKPRQKDIQMSNWNNKTAEQELDHSRTVAKPRQRDAQMSNHSTGTAGGELEHSSTVYKTNQKDIQMSNWNNKTAEQELDHSRTVAKPRQRDAQMSNHSTGTAEGELEHSSTVYKTNQKDIQMSNWNNKTAEQELDHARTVYKPRQRDAQMSNHSTGTAEGELEHSSTVYKTNQKDIQMSNWNNKTAEQELDHARTVYKPRQRDAQMSNHSTGTAEHVLDHSSTVYKPRQKDIQMSNCGNGTAKRELDHSRADYKTNKKDIQMSNWNNKTVEQELDHYKPRQRDAQMSNHSYGTAERELEHSSTIQKDIQMSNCSDETAKHELNHFSIVNKTRQNETKNNIDVDQKKQYTPMAHTTQNPLIDSRKITSTVKERQRTGIQDTVTFKDDDIEASMVTESSATDIGTKMRSQRTLNNQRSDRTALISENGSNSNDQNPYQNNKDIDSAAKISFGHIKTSQIPKDEKHHFKNDPSNENNVSRTTRVDREEKQSLKENHKKQESGYNSNESKTIDSVYIKHETKTVESRHGQHHYSSLAAKNSASVKNDLPVQCKPILSSRQPKPKEAVLEQTAQFKSLDNGKRENSSYNNGFLQQTNSDMLRADKHRFPTTNGNKENSNRLAGPHPKVIAVDAKLPADNEQANIEFSNRHVLNGPTKYLDNTSNQLSINKTTKNLENRSSEKKVNDFGGYYQNGRSGDNNNKMDNSSGNHTPKEEASGSNDVIVDWNDYSRPVSEKNETDSCWNYNTASSKSGANSTKRADESHVQKYSAPKTECDRIDRLSIASIKPTNTKQMPVNPQNNEMNETTIGLAEYRPDDPRKVKSDQRSMIYDNNGALPEHQERTDPALSLYRTERNVPADKALENASNQLSVGSENCVLHYLHVDKHQGVYIKSEAGESDQKVLENFSLSCSKIKNIFDRSRYRRKSQDPGTDTGKMLPGDQDPTFRNIREEGVLFHIPSCNISEKLPTAYWVVGRQRSLTETYVCFKDGVPQSSVELAFKLAFGLKPG